MLAAVRVPHCTCIISDGSHHGRVGELSDYGLLCVCVCVCSAFCFLYNTLYKLFLVGLCSTCL